ncbi:MAG: hypothetical protein Q4D81_00705, partial [Eubacteriales bacterium]|nr:hypothetical protein [Eubacteriales bacterium]
KEGKEDLKKENNSLKAEEQDLRKEQTEDAGTAADAGPVSASAAVHGDGIMPESGDAPSAGAGTAASAGPADAADAERASNSAAGAGTAADAGPAPDEPAPASAVGTESGERKLREKKSRKKNGTGRGPALKVVLIPAVLLAAAFAAVFFGYCGWVRFPWMESRVFWENGGILRDSWILDEEEYYHTDEDGRLMTGLREINGFRYLFDPETGQMQTGWQTVSKEGTETRMYFRSPSGKAAAGWTKIGKSRYYFSPEGEVQTGWLEIDGKKYYFDGQGCCLTGWQKIDGKEVYLGEDGVLRTGWQEIEGEEVYLGEDGAPRTGWTQIDGKQYLLDKNGRKQTGMQTVKGKTYYFDHDGAMKTGWISIEGKKYYFDKKGVLQTGLVTADGETYYLSEDGMIEQGWHEEDGGRFYVCSDGFVLDPGGETGSYGRLVIRGMDLDVCLYTASSREEYQKIVDRENCALVVQERRDLEPVIADRRSQGFDMTKITVGSRAVVLYADGNVQEFSCIRRTWGTNTGADVVDEFGTSIWRQNEGGICSYSSAGTGNKEDVIVVFWDPVASSAGSGQPEEAEEETELD